MWLLRQQQYPLPPLISYKIPRIRVLCRVSGQFLNRYMVPCAHRFLGVIVGTSNGTQPFTTSSLPPMSTIQVLINGNTVQGELQHIAQILGMVSDTITTPVPVIQEPEVEYTFWDSLIKTECANVLREFYPNDADEKAISILDGLKVCRRNEDYRFLIPTYFQFGASDNLKIRQLLKLVSAADRIIHFTNTRAYTKQQLSSLRSEVKFARMCPECGAMANRFHDAIMKDSNVTI